MYLKQIMFLGYILLQLLCIYVGLRLLAYWDCGFESRRGHECLSLVNVVFCQVKVPVSG
jgi:hypothetical protein